MFIFNKFKKFLLKLFSYDLRYTLAARLWRLLSGPILLLFILFYLDTETQGYWFTIVSLAALFAFADLGFATILLQFAAYEFAHLSFDKHQRFVGSRLQINRISSLFIFSIKWGGLATAITFPLLFTIGCFLLSRKDSMINWFLPWLIYNLASAIAFLNSLILAFFEGCNSVGTVQKIRFYTGIILSLGTIIGLIVNAKLYALTIALLISSFFGAYLIYANYQATIKQMLFLRKELRYFWEKDILPLLWRYAISWTSGYFSFQIFTPLAFHYFGATAAGQVGLSIALWSGIYNIANVWLTIIGPKISIYVARKERQTLDKGIHRCLLLSTITYLLGATFAFIIVFFPNYNILITERFVDKLSMLIIATCWFLQTITGPLVAYVRGHLEEPFLAIFLVSAIYITLSTLATSAYLPFRYYFLGFLSSYLFGLPWIYVIFRKYKIRACIPLLIKAPQ